MINKWLIGSVGVWLLSAWVAVRQPDVVRNFQLGSAMVRMDTIKPKHDPESGLVIDETMPIVKGQCTACHSSKLILQSHFDRDKWIERIRWMQRTQKLWDLGDTEKPILDYLTKYYGPIKTPFDGRRLPLDPPRWHSR